MKEYFLPQASAYRQGEMYVKKEGSIVRDMAISTTDHNLIYLLIPRKTKP
jgi:hypothetical protein